MTAQRHPWPGSDEIHLWRTALAAVPDRPETLSPDERERADRFHFERDRGAFRAGRAWLRSVLAGYLGIAPAAIAFGYGPHGKPHLADFPDLRFNLAHSGGWAALAVATGREVGIDIEAIRAIAERVERLVFTPAEIAQLDRLPAAQRRTGFYNAWTRKEAYLKALGSGLAVPLQSFEVSLATDEPACLLAVAGAPDEAAQWQLAALDIGPGLAGTLASRPGGWTARWVLPE